MPKLPKSLAREVKELLQELQTVAGRCETLAGTIGELTEGWRQIELNRSDAWQESDAGLAYDDQVTAIEAIGEHLQHLNEAIDEIALLDAMP